MLMMMRILHSTNVLHLPMLRICLLQDQLLFCDDCDRGYHMYCLSPPLSEPPEGEVLPLQTCFLLGSGQGTVC